MSENRCLVRRQKTLVVAVPCDAFRSLWSNVWREDSVGVPMTQACLMDKYP
jgi:hypothetical protein